jgi:HTH-type transcriptional regulator/antitoxin HigA
MPSTTGVTPANDGAEVVVEIRIVKTDRQYRRYLAEIGRIAVTDPDPRSAAGARLELLAKLVEDYEKVRFPIGKPDAVEAIQFRMEQQGLRQKDLAELLGGKNRASEILSRKRPLTVPMIRALSRHLQIPAELLVR